jgi:hypothetical protein
MSFKDKGYSHIQNVLSKEMCDIATQYALFEKMNDSKGVYLEEDYAQVPGAHALYSDYLMESLLLLLKPVAEKHSELELIPTYSYYRIYNPGDILHPHRDRPSCEISLSVTLGFRYNDVSDNYRWPIFMENNPIVVEQGDAILYKGCEKEHWRDSLKAGKNSYHVQVFLHYVDANGPYAKEYKYDGRPTIGIKKENIR